MITETVSDDVRWYKRANPDEVDPNAHLRLVQLVKRIRRNQSYQMRDCLIFASLYGSAPLMGLSPGMYARSSSADASLSLNVVKNMVNSVVSRIAAKATPKPNYATEDGDYQKQFDAEELNKGVSGLLYLSKFRRKSRIFTRDALVFGTGVPKIYADHKARKVCMDRLFRWECTVDDSEAEHGEPCSQFFHKWYDKRKLIEDHPEFEQQIERAVKTSLASDEGEYGFDPTTERVLVYEGYHLPSSRSAGDGRWTKVIDGATLHDVRWNGKDFPTVPLRWNEPLMGYWGDGLAGDLKGIQAEINKLLREIKKGMHLIRGHYLVENSSKVVTSHIQNDLAAIIRYTGVMPQYQAPSIISPEVYQHLWNLYAKAYEISGISQLAAQSQKPAGLDSGAAIREFNDQQTERFLDFGQTLEDWSTDVGERHVDAARELAAKGSFPVRAVEIGTYSEVDWKDLPDPDGFVMQVFPVSQLPSTPTGRLQYAQDMLKLNVFDPQDVAEAIGTHDTKALTDRKLAHRRLVEKMISRMVRGGKQESPEPTMLFDEAIAIARDAYLDYRAKGLPEDRLKRLLTFIVLCRDLKKKEAAANAPPPPAAPSGMPPGAPPMPMPMPAPAPTAQPPTM